MTYVPESVDRFPVAGDPRIVGHGLVWDRIGLRVDRHGVHELVRCPYCGVDFAPSQDWSVCPHPHRFEPLPTDREMRAAVRRSWPWWRRAWVWVAEHPRTACVLALGLGSLVGVAVRALALIGGGA